ncbi:MAG: 3-phenylpropionate/cinnamic acid dioxygenase subunit beta [Acidimicrobiales bacterium]|nr:aromatic-ring-hydroxylating dioxygenase subunit beta [Hyphomonadaceae bacterium]RZV43185.1 MAG: 3-phenylpropionate/cinnamic acid dioxygenase subunit beta [Acidimicrobiales bacterium]
MTANTKPIAANKEKRIPVGSETYNRITEALYEEAMWLDEMRLEEWGDFLAPDLIYRAPLRLSRQRDEQAASIVHTMNHYDEDYGTLMGRIARLTQTKSAWAEDPPSRTRHFVSNILVRETGKTDEYAVKSNGLLTRNRFEEDHMQVISYVRNDILRDVNGSLKLAKREIVFDMAVLGTQNLSIFL